MKIALLTVVVAIGVLAGGLVTGVLAAEKVPARKAAVDKAGGDRAEAKKAMQEKAEKAKEARAAKVDEAKEARAEKAEKAKETRSEKKEEMQNKAQEGREEVVDNRQNRQDKRIQHGINKGYLTADEIKTLESQQASIAAMEESFKSDGKLNGSEFKQLQTALNDASRSIWSEKHDTDGVQMPAYRLGKNVFLKSGVISENMTGAEARAILKDQRRMMEIKKKLSSDDLSADERAKLQDEYDTLLNKYFETK